MKRIIVAMLLAIAISTNTGCFIPLYSADPVERTEELIITSENQRAMRDEWRRFWFLDQPDHSRAMRVHGGIL